MPPKICSSDILSEGKECIIEFKPCETFKEININFEVEPEPDECYCNLLDKDDMFVAELVYSILKQLNLKCKKHKHKHKYRHKHKHKCKYIGNK